MTRRAPRQDFDESAARVGNASDHAAGVKAVGIALKRAYDEMGAYRSAQTLLRLNQADGFDCQGCAWPDPDVKHRHSAEFCENGAKAVAEEATVRRVGPDFFAEHSVAQLRERTDHWLGQQGRITHPMVLRAGATHYEPVAWEEAFALIGRHLNALASPDEAIFYTSGKVSNEAAFAFQLFVRAYGTNNLPDCSNMCHESTSVGLLDVIGIGKGSVSLEDIHRADLIVVAGQNPGTNHPRMLSALEEAKGRGAKILAINPLREAGLVRFKNPQRARGVVGHGTALADLHLPVRLGGDLALFQAIGSLLLEWDAVDRDFIAEHTHGFEEWAAGIARLDWAEVHESTGLSREQIVQAAQLLRDSAATVFCWAMGITQHRNGVATVKEIANLAFLQGSIGRPGAGLCPVRGHSNVQGDRTMGIWERPQAWFLDALEAEFGFEPPREHGYDAVSATTALLEGRAKVFFGMGGNFVSAMPDTLVVERAMAGADLTVHVSTKLNRSHLSHGAEALILPAMGRSERDLTGGGVQRVTVEDSMSAVHASRGPLEPASVHLRSEVDIVCSMAEATLAGRTDATGQLPWSEFRADYGAIRRRIARVIPGFQGFEELIDRPGGFVLPHPPRDSRTFPTPNGKANFTATPLSVIRVPAGRLLLQTFRSHDQFNTTIYDLNDRYRGIKGGRRVVFVNAEDIAELGLTDGQLVDLISEWEDGSTRSVPSFRVVSYDQPRGCAAAYYPEANPLVPLTHTAAGSNQPAYKSVVIRIVPAADPTARPNSDAGTITLPEALPAGAVAGSALAQ